MSSTKGVKVEQADLMALGDEELVAKVYELADDEEREAIYVGLDELLERFAVDVLRRVRWAELADDPDRTGEMDAWLEGLEARAALRPLAQELDEGEEREFA
jgi:hypothetical protein